MVATAVSATQIDLSWSAATDNVAVNGYLVYRDGGNAPIATVSGTMHSDQGLSASTTYRYTVVALDAANNLSTPSPSTSATTLAATSPPPPPTTGGSLSTLAAAMLPGTWAELSSNGFNGGALLQTVPGSHINEYADKGVWNPNTREAYFVGASHANAGPNTAEKFIRYADAANTWTTISALPSNPTYQAHSYQHNAIDTATGDVYYRPYNSRELLRFRGNAWSNMSPLPAGSVQVAGALEGFPERQGLLFVDGDWGVWWYRIAANSWTQLAHTNGGSGGGLPKLALGPYHNVAVYNPVHKIVLFGGGNGSAALYRLDQNGAITTESAAPIPVAVNSTIFTVDPASGDYLLFGNSRVFWEYDPGTKTWTQLPASQHPPFFGTARDGPALGTVAFPITSYGVVMFTTWNDASNSKVYVYKHK